MIRVRIERSPEDRSIHFVRSSGHANYAEHGSDIVCAGVSVVTVGTVNAIEALLGVKLASKMKDGFLEFAVPNGIHEELHGKIQLLLESMVVMLQSIQENYGNYISIDEITKRRR